MKRRIKNCLATTGLALILLAIVAVIYQGRFLCIDTVFQIFLVSIFIHLVLVVFERFESKYYMIEIVAEVGIVLIILIIAGFLFHWYSSVPIGVLLLLGIAVYFIGCMIDMFRVHSDINVINNCLYKNKKIQ